MKSTSRTIAKIIVGVFAIIGLQAAAFAVPLTYTLSGVTFSDNATASGTFTYDSDTNQYTGVNITTTTGILNGATFTFACVTPCNGVAPTSGAVLLLTASPSSDLTGTPALELSFGFPLTNQGGNRQLAGQQDRCLDATCFGVTPPVRTITAGTITALRPLPLQVPTLSNWSLIVLALMLVAGFAAFSRRKSVGQ